MNDKAAEKLRHHILDALDRQPFLQREGDCFFYEIYADYRGRDGQRHRDQAPVRRRPHAEFLGVAGGMVFRLRVSAER